MSYKNPRIKSLNLTVMDVIKAMADGNPGALRVCAEVMKYAEMIDPDSVMGGLGVILSFDTLDIYESRIWMLYKDVCGEDYGVMLAVLRASQLGGLEGCDEKAINQAIDHRGEGLNLKKIVAAVQKRLPAFKVDGWKVKA